jgi:diacylglycerol kinase family enzyme
MEKLGIIVNVNASGNKRDKELPSKIKDIIGESALLRVTSELSELNDVAHEFSKKEIEVVGISGGDGTLHHTLTNLFHAYKEKIPRVFFMCGGTMNTIAKASGLRKNQLEVLKKVKECLYNKIPVKVIKKNLIKIGNKFGFILGGGLVTSLLNEYYSGEERGPKKAARVVWMLARAAIIRGKEYKRLFPVVRGLVKADGIIRKFESLTAFLGATVNEIGLGFHITYMGGKTENGFHFLASELSPFEYVLRLPKLYFGIPIKSRKVFDRICERVEMEFEDDVYYTIDGDMYLTEGKKLCAEFGPSIEILAP